MASLTRLQWWVIPLGSLLGTSSPPLLSLLRRTRTASPSTTRTGIPQDILLPLFLLASPHCPLPRPP